MVQSHLLPRDFLLDVSRLVWRAWRGRLPTGIDRVCEAYVERLGARSQAVVQRAGSYLVLSPQRSDRLFELLLAEKPVSRLAFVKLGVIAFPAALTTAVPAGAIYLNVGHTGLNEPSLPSWVARHRLRAVYLIHDLIPLTHPQFCRDGEVEKHRQRMRNVLDSAAGVIGNSRVTLDELANFARVEGRSMPSSVAAWLSGEDVPLEAPPRRESRPHFVVVGTIEGRKNHKILLDVWRNMVAERGAAVPLLVIIGQRGWEADDVFKQLDQLEELQGHVLELCACSDDDLAGWLAGAQALLMPSFAEGFGLPVIEALQLGTPVIASNLPVYREIAGDIPTYLNPHDRAAWKRAIEIFAVGRETRCMPTFRVPTWQDHFRKVEAWLNSL